MTDIFKYYQEHIIPRDIYPNVSLAENHFLRFISRVQSEPEIHTRQIAIQTHYEYLIMNVSWKGFSTRLIVVVEDDMKPEYILEGIMLQLEQSLMSKGQEGIYYRWLEENILDLSKSEDDL